MRGNTSVRCMMVGLWLLGGTGAAHAVVIDNFNVASPAISVPGDFSRQVNAVSLGAYDRGLHLTAGRGNTPPDPSMSISFPDNFPMAGTDLVEGGVGSGLAYMHNYNDDLGASLRGYTTLIYGAGIVGNESAYQNYFTPGSSVVFDFLAEGSTQFEVDVAYADFNTSNNTLGLFLCDTATCRGVSGFARPGTFIFTFSNFDQPYIIGGTVIFPAIDMSEITQIMLRMDGEYFYPTSGSPAVGPVQGSAGTLPPAAGLCPDCSARMVLTEFRTNVLAPPVSSVPEPATLALLGLGLLSTGLQRRGHQRRGQVLNRDRGQRGVRAHGS